MTKQPLMLIILDGWGLRDETQDNAVALARTPHYDAWMKSCPHTAIDASGHAVGLPAGIMGNSEVGHLNMGAGRIVYVGLTRIYSAIEDGSFFFNPALLKAFTAAREKKSTLHLMGLVSDGAVHSHQDHLDALLEMAKRQKVSKVGIHAFTDGRDTPPKNGVEYLRRLEEKIAAIGVGEIATITGRYYAMDRDQRWERTERAYDAMVLGEGLRVSSGLQAMAAAYARNETDEFIQPIVLTDASGRPRATVQDGDAAIFFNFRADRARQLTRALTETSFVGFTRKKFPRLSEFICMGEYDKSLPLPVAFPPAALKNIFPAILSERGLKQLRIAETEKYAHVTFFFNGGEEAVYPGEDRVLIPSPREVATYDLKPEMSAARLADEVIRNIERDVYDFIVLNFANPDMVGHTGNLSAAIRAVETVDEQLGRVYAALSARGGTMVVTADHGNCEMMRDARGEIHTAHTVDLVPFLIVGDAYAGATLRPGGTLADVAPTLLQMLRIAPPAEMTGKSLVV